MEKVSRIWNQNPLDIKPSKEGTDYEQTLAENEYAYKSYKIYPHLLKRNTREGYIDDLSVNAFGSSFKTPIFSPIWET